MEGMEQVVIGELTMIADEAGETDIMSGMIGTGGTRMDTGGRGTVQQAAGERTHCPIVMRDEMLKHLVMARIIRKTGTQTLGMGGW